MNPLLVGGMTLNANRHIAWTGLILIAALQSSVVFGEGPIQGQEKPASPDRVTVNLQFPGGTLAEYVKALQRLSPNINIIVASSDAGEIKLPAIKLDSVAPKVAVELVRGDYQITSDAIAHVWVDVWDAPGRATTGSVFRIRTQVDKARSSVQVRVWNIGDLLGADRQPDGVLTAVETAVGLLDWISRPATIRYHEDTKLLVASGEHEQLQAIDRVVDGIRSGMARDYELAAAAGGTDAIAGLFGWIEDMRRFDAEQEEKGKSYEEVAARIQELTRLLENVRAEVQQKDRLIHDLERRLGQKEKKQ